jgi:hypothetical protein
MPPKKKSPIENSIKQQLEANRSKNLLYENVEESMEIEPGFLAALEELVDSSGGKNTSNGVSAEVVACAAQALLKRLSSVNQYLSIRYCHSDLGPFFLSSPIWLAIILFRWARPICLSWKPCNPPNCRLR